MAEYLCLRQNLSEKYASFNSSFSLFPTYFFTNSSLNVSMSKKYIWVCQPQSVIKFGQKFLLKTVSANWKQLKYINVQRYLSKIFQFSINLVKTLVHENKSIQDTAAIIYHRTHIVVFRNFLAISYPISYFSIS